MTALLDIFHERRNHMKLAFTTSGDNLDALLDSRFGRAPKILIYDLNTNTFHVIDNQQNRNAVQGAGIQTAEMIVRMGVNYIVTGHCGPKAFQVLSAAGVKVFNTGASTVAEALEQFRAGHLATSSSADVEGHWT